MTKSDTRFCSPNQKWQIKSARTTSRADFLYLSELFIYCNKLGVLAIPRQGQCDKAGVAFFSKQWGGKNKKKAGRELNGRTYDEMPEMELQRSV